MTKTISKSFTIAKQLPPDLAKLHDNDADGIWIYASVELPEGDSDGDIIRIDGISLEPYHNPPDSRIKVLAQHLTSLPNGEAPVVGVVADAVKTAIARNGRVLRALALYVNWLKDADGKMLPLSQH